MTGLPADSIFKDRAEHTETVCWHIDIYMKLILNQLVWELIYNQFTIQKICHRKCSSVELRNYPIWISLEI